jgi:hypothetical protein
MRSRIFGLVLSAFLVFGMAGCNSKKDQTAQTPPAATDQTAQPTPSGTPGGQMSQPGATESSPSTANAPAAQPMQPPVEAAKEEPPPPPPPPLVVASGTSLLVRLGSTLDTKSAQTGQPFNGVLARSVVVHGEVAIPAGAGVSGSVVDSKSPGRFKGEGVLSITLNSIDIRGVPREIATSTFSQTVKGKGKRTAVAVGGGTGAGALIGGIAGGGNGALIGGLVGAGAGTAGAAFTGNKDLQIPAETVVTFRLANSITVPHPEKKNKSASDEAPPQ